jgi:hypothetical protein
MPSNHPAAGSSPAAVAVSDVDIYARAALLMIEATASGLET